VCFFFFFSNSFFSVFGLGEEWPANWNHSRLCDFHAERKSCWREREKESESWFCIVGGAQRRSKVQRDRREGHCFFWRVLLRHSLSLITFFVFVTLKTPHSCIVRVIKSEEGQWPKNCKNIYFIIKI
jgi:hypothetical protein